MRLQRRLHRIPMHVQLCGDRADLPVFGKEQVPDFRNHLRSDHDSLPLPEDINDHGDPGSHGLADKFAVAMTLRQALKYLQPRCRETLYLHYYEGRSAVDVAREMDTTSRYAEKLIHNCLKRVREIYFSITAVRH